MNQQQQTIDISKISEQLSKKEASINNAEKARIQAETKKEGFRHQYAELNSEIKALGIEPKEAKEYRLKLEEEILSEMKALEALIPEGY